MATTRPGQICNRKEAQLSTAETAAQAGAKYIWRSRYTNGRNDGWATGWAAGWKTAFCEGASVPAELSTGCKERDHSDPSLVLHEAAVENEEEDMPALEMTEECARLLASSPKTNKRRKFIPRDRGLNEEEQFDIGGLAEKRHRRNAEKLYGDDVGEIAELEADLSASFGQIAAETSPNYWPVVSLRDGARPCERICSS